MKSNTPRGISEEMMQLLSPGKGDDCKAALALTCLGYCEYYRGDEGGKGCGGLAAVMRGVVSGKIGLVQVSHLLEVPPVPARRSGCLINEMCSLCSYREDGCDYMSDTPPPDATPCGGYRLIQALLDCGALTPGVVRTLIQNTGRRPQDAE